MPKMFYEGEGLKTEIKFAVASTYDKFKGKWGDISIDKMSWVDTWALGLAGYSVENINNATHFCLSNSRRSPSFKEFSVYCERVVNKQCLSDAIISDEEVLAKELIAYAEGISQNISLLNVFLIAAGMTDAKICQAFGMKFDEKHVDLDFGPRARTFGYSCVDWTLDAIERDGFWKDFLAKKLF